MLSMLLNANVTFDVGQPLPDGFSTSDHLNVTVYLQLGSSAAVMLNHTIIPIGAVGYELPINPDDISPLSEPYNISCVATPVSSGGSIGSFNSSMVHYTKLFRLPENPYSGSTTKIDRKTGGMLRLKTDGSWAPFLPFGFYTFTYDIISNLSIIDAMARDG
jgi:hypothetical protein